MAESAALLVDEVFPEQPVRQWVLSFPYPLRFLFASQPAIMSQVLGIVYRVIATHLIKKAGFSLHAGVMARTDERQKLERLCRYISRPAVSEKRLSLTTNGQVRYQLKTPYRDGTTYVIFEPLDFIARLAALVPKPRVNLTRFHGVFAPNSKHRASVKTAKRGKGAKPKATAEQQESMPVQRRAAMTWAQRLKRVFGIDIETCPVCGGALRIIACIEDPAVIKTILTHLETKNASTVPSRSPPCRAPPPVDLFD